MTLASWLRWEGGGICPPDRCFSWERHQSHLPPVSSRRRVNIVPEMGWLPHEFRRLALFIRETEGTNGLEGQSFASGGRTKKVDGLSLRQLRAWGRLGKVSAGVVAEWRGVVPSDCRVLNLRVKRKSTPTPTVPLVETTNWYGTFSRAPTSANLFSSVLCYVRYTAMGRALRLILPIKVSTDYLRHPNEVRTSQPPSTFKVGRRVTDGLVETRTPPASQFDQSSPSMNIVRLLLWRMDHAQPSPMLKRMAIPSTNELLVWSG